MINKTMQHVVRELNQYFRIKYEFKEDMAVLSNIVEQDGSQIPYAEGKLIVTLVNIEKDTSTAVPPVMSGIPGEKTNTTKFSPVYLNLYIMFSTNFSGKNYDEGLKILSDTIGFFQKKPVFTKNTVPDLDEDIEKLIFSIENLNIKDLSSLWSIISNKYIPSILYQTRLIVIDSYAVKARTPKVEQALIQTLTR
jgi:hypothetical protein